MFRSRAKFILHRFRSRYIYESRFTEVTRTMRNSFCQDSVDNCRFFEDEYFRSLSRSSRIFQIKWRSLHMNCTMNFVPMFRLLNFILREMNEYLECFSYCKVIFLHRVPVLSLINIFCFCIIWSLKSRI